MADFVIGCGETVLWCCLRDRSHARKQKKGDAVLLWGPVGAGKTSLWYLWREGEFPRTITSMSPNEDQMVIQTAEGQRKQKMTVIDFPGHQRMRAELLNRHLRRAKKIVFVVDASTLKSDVAPVAQQLFDLLTRSFVSEANIPVIVACNKSDDPTAVSSSVAKNLLEAELYVVGYELGEIFNYDFVNFLVILFHF